MLFRKKMPVDCTYCAHCAGLDEDNCVLCSKKGIVVPTDKCRKFRYSPVKRIPPKPKAPDFTKYKAEDFSL